MILKSSMSSLRKFLLTIAMILLAVAADLMHWPDAARVDVMSTPRSFSSVQFFSPCSFSHAVSRVAVVADVHDFALVCIEL